MGTIRLSSNWTLILRLFIPIAWITFFSSFLLSSFLANPVEVPQLAKHSFRLAVLAFILGGIGFFYFTFFRLKRVDADEQFIYVTNYFKTYRYTFDSIERIQIYDHILFKGIHIILRDKGKFGRRLIFLPKMLHFNRFIENSGLETLLEKK
jgi:hypothetical protein